MVKSKKPFKPNKKSFNPFKKKTKKPSKKFYCTLCEKIVLRPNQIKSRKNYPYGKKSKATTTHIHVCDGGCLVELKGHKDGNTRTGS